MSTSCSICIHILQNCCSRSTTILALVVHFISLQCITVHYSKIHYITVQYSTVFLAVGNVSAGENCMENNYLIIFSIMAVKSSIQTGAPSLGN